MRMHMGKVEGDPPEGSAPPIGRELAPLVDLQDKAMNAFRGVESKLNARIRNCLPLNSYFT